MLNTHSKLLTTMCVSDITSVYIALSSMGIGVILGGPEGAPTFLHSIALEMH